MLTGVHGSEDAGVYRLSQELAIVQTVDFFTPIVDDPFIFGCASATNSLSDVYAMGAKPVTALNIVCFPLSKLPMDYLKQILAGGLSAIKEARASLVGGHSVEDDEPKYGLAVTGVVHPDKIMTNSALEIGDKLILTKALGTGIIATALKADLASKEAMDSMTRSMCQLNRTASEVAVHMGVKACTDITGFGLAGHLTEMARAGKKKVKLNANSPRLLPTAIDLASMGMIPAGAHTNRKFYQSWISIASDLKPEIIDLMFDPQTSGGLLLGAKAEIAENLMNELRSRGIEESRIIGEVISDDSEGFVEIEP